jgi:hypothetical protein
MVATAQTADSAKHFLLNRLLEQAEHDGETLSEIEQRMFLFSETSGGTPDYDASATFDAECDSSEYEAKIAKLLRRAYTRDKKSSGTKVCWEKYLEALRNEDFYGLVMVDQAGIPRAKPEIFRAKSDILKFAAEFGLFAAIEVVIIAVGSLLVFQPGKLHLNLPDWFRLLLMPVFAWLLWLGGKLPGYLGRVKSRKMAELDQN